MAHHFLLLAIATIMAAILLSLCQPTAAKSAVVDLDGNPLEVGSQYYVPTSGRGAAGRGGLTYWSKPPRLCPTYVGQLRHWVDEGHPVSFYPANSSQEQINIGDDVNIVFEGPNYCRDSGVWRLTMDNRTMIPYVATNGEIGNSGAETSATWFKIQKSTEISYRIVHCFSRPEITGGKREICQQLNAIERDYSSPISFLSPVPMDQPLLFFGFFFKKAVPPPTTTTTYY